MVFTHDMADWLSFNIDENWLEENISWKDFGTGVRLGKLKREEKTSLVLYEAQSEVEVDAFMPHSHPGGECYVVLEGEVWDEDGTYPTGSIVWMDPESTHTPKTRGKTLILVLWPQGVKGCLTYASVAGADSSMFQPSKPVSAVMPQKNNGGMSSGESFHSTFSVA